MQDNKEFWDKQAEIFKTDINAVNFDKNAENLELENIKKLLDNGKVICDMGCGNGRTIFHMLEEQIDSKFYGIDFTKGMIESANEYKTLNNHVNCEFFNYSATSSEILTLFEFQFDTVISKRLLINLKGESKYEAINNIYSILKNDGHYIMVENFIEPLERINNLRKVLKLDPIKVHQFNEYISEETFFERIKDKFVVEKKIDFLSLYYFISRVFNAMDEKPNYMSKINLTAVDITKAGIMPIEGYSPEVLYVLKKV